MDPNQMTHGTAMMDTLWDMLGKNSQRSRLRVPGLPPDRSVRQQPHHHDVRRRQRHRNGGQSGREVINLSLAGSGDSPLLTKRWSRRTTWACCSSGQPATMAAPRPIFRRQPECPVSDFQRSFWQPRQLCKSQQFGGPPGAGHCGCLFQRPRLPGYWNLHRGANATGAATGLAINNHQTPLEAAPNLTRCPLRPRQKTLIGTMQLIDGERGRLDRSRWRTADGPATFAQAHQMVNGIRLRQLFGETPNRATGRSRSPFQMHPSP